LLSYSLPCCCVIDLLGHRRCQAFCFYFVSKRPKSRSGALRSVSWHVQPQPYTQLYSSGGLVHRRLKAAYSYSDDRQTERYQDNYPQPP
jgi:hypothetical protein